MTTYRLTSLEEPTDEQLQALMDQVGIAVRESSRRAEQEKKRRLEEVVRHIEARNRSKQAAVAL